MLRVAGIGSAGVGLFDSLLNCLWGIRAIRLPARGFSFGRLVRTFGMTLLVMLVET